MKLGRQRNYNKGLWVNALLVWCLNSVLNVKVLVGAFNQEKASYSSYLEAYSVIVKTLPRFVRSSSRHAALAGWLLPVARLSHLAACWPGLAWLPSSATPARNHHQ